MQEAVCLFVRMRLVSKLTLAIIAVLCLVLAIRGYLSVRRERALFETDMQRDEHLIGRALSAAVAFVWQRDGEAHAMQMLTTANDREDGVRIRWVWLDAPAGDPQGAVMPVEARDALTRGADVSRAERSEGRFYTYVPVPLDGPRRGAIELSEPLEEQERYVRASVLYAAITTLLLVALSGVLAMGLGNFFVGRPIKALIDKARRIGAGDLEGPLVLRQRDELAELAREMNLMCERLGDARARLGNEMSGRIVALEQLRHADRLTTIGKLASGVAHELGTPLNVIDARAKMIASEPSPDAATHNAKIIVEQAERMTRIIRHLLDFARRRGPQKAPTDLFVVAQQTIAMLAPLSAKHDVSLSLVERRGEALAEVDAAQMEQVLTNLIVNGVQSMKPRGGTLRVAIGVERASPPPEHEGAAGEYLSIRVEDEGAGIAERDLPHVFEPFFTTKDVGEGSGLGLSVAYGIVREHGGWIEVQSEVEKGSAFTVFLPLGMSPRGEA